MLYRSHSFSSGKARCLNVDAWKCQNALDDVLGVGTIAEFIPSLYEAVQRIDVYFVLESKWSHTRNEWQLQKNVPRGGIARKGNFRINA